VSACRSAFQLLALLAITLAPDWMFEIIGVTGLLSASTTWKWPEPAGAPASEERAPERLKHIRRWKCS
jgi:hypothetical protein